MSVDLLSVIDFREPCYGKTSTHTGIHAGSHASQQDVSAIACVAGTR